MHEEMPPHAAMEILRACGAPRWNHITRTHPPEVSRPSSITFDQDVVKVARHLLACPESEWTKEHWLQLTLPMKYGGFGIMSYSDLVSETFTASRHLYLKEKESPAASSNPPQEPDAPAVDAQGAELAVKIESQESKPSASQLASPSQLDSEKVPTVKEAREVLNKQKLEDLNSTDDRTRARLKSCVGPSDWLRGKPIGGDEAWRMTHRFRIGLPMMPDAKRCRCGSNNLVGTALDDHIMTCRKATGYTTIHRHDTVQNAIRTFLRSQGVVTSDAPSGYHADGSGKKPDFIIHGLSRPICVDVSVTHPCAQSLTKSSAQQGGKAAGKREKDKESKHGQAAKSHAHDFVPFVFETFGRPGSQAKDLVERLIKKLALPDDFWRNFWLTASTALQYGNADLRHNASIRASRGTRAKSWRAPLKILLS